MSPLPARLKALIFDFDGTLATGRYDFQGIREGVYALAGEYSVAAPELESLYILEAVERAAEIIAAGQGDAQSFRDRAARIILDGELRGARDSHLVPGAAEAMKRLRDEGYRLAVVTRNSRTAVETIPGATSLACDAFLTRESVSRVKPDPEHVRAALIAVGCEAAEAAMVGDHPMDIAVGKAAGTATVGVLTGGGTRETLGAAGADVIVESVVDLVAMLVGAACDT